MKTVFEELREARAEIEKMTARKNFIINTSHQHTEHVPEWVLQTLKGENPHAEIRDDDLSYHLG